MKMHIAAVLAITSSFMLGSAFAADTPAPAAASPHAGMHGQAAGAEPLKPLPKQDKLTVRGWSSPAPAAWTPVQPASAMRAAQFILPGGTGKADDDGEMVVYFFPAGDGGSQDANIQRWTAEVTDAAGKPVKPAVTTSKTGMTKVTLVTLQGAYTRGANMLPDAKRKTGQTLMVAMVETTMGRITLQAYGPSKTVAAHRDSFIKLANGFVPG
ncbi:hypothetical protein GJ698_12635 [Pseudoduganella sp. FT26W]|uniref:Uncharacterized protein n=1 Tax=Duganella aquatilis TaxID=2666082 RepID=A0A844CVV4_9BURK|nr:hypothetical protein [Duganella aquatilis]MRW84927.1 hypothetical protein [Duganella aquatilis]